MRTAHGARARPAVVLASAGRPDVLANVLADVLNQTVPELQVVIAVPDRASLPEAGLAARVVVAPYARGLTKQRNAGIAAAVGATHIFFFDDDSVVRRDYVENAMMHFESNPAVVAVTGRVLKDGATGEAVDLHEAQRVVEVSESQLCSGRWEPSRTLYGCNFAYKRVAAPDEFFDERLPLYGWLEDHDFARRMLRHGALVKLDDCVIVHRGVKSGGRTAHTRLGYSQVMNPCYLFRAGSFPLWLTFWEIFRPTAKNVIRSIMHPERSWRRQRLKGNVRAAADVLRGRFIPERAVGLE